MTVTPHVAGATEIKAARSARITAILFALFAVASAAASRAVGDEHARFSLWIAESGGDAVNLDLPVAIGWIVSAFIAAVSAARIWIGGAGVRWRRYLAAALPILILSILATLLNGVPANLNRLVTGSLAYAGPVAIGALAGIISERSGVLNIAIEGKFLMGAAAGTLASSVLGVAIAGPIAWALMGAAMGFLLAWFGLRFKVDQIIVGVVLNIAAAGITDFLFLRVFSRYRELNLPISIDDIRIPLLADLPVIGPLIFVGSPYLYGSIVLVVFFTYMLYRTTWGLRLRASGEQPSAAGTVGVDVIKLRYRAMLIAGALAGLAGSSLALSGTGGFAMGISAGRGFIALAAVIFGAWNPIAAFGAALVFAFADSAQSLLSILGVPVPPQFLASVPYIVTIVVVAGLVGRVRGPAAAGQPYEQG
jgi:ABC-type uncharacterized transport system permease subunit